MGTSLTSSQVSLFQGGASNISGAVSDLFQGLYTAPAEAAAATAQADAASASASADLLQGQGDILEGETYGEAATLAQQNAAYTAASTNIQEGGKYSRKLVTPAMRGFIHELTRHVAGIRDRS